MLYKVVHRGAGHRHAGAADQGLQTAIVDGSRSTRTTGPRPPTPPTPATPVTSVRELMSVLKILSSVGAQVWFNDGCTKSWCCRRLNMATMADWEHVFAQRPGNSNPSPSSRQPRVTPSVMHGVGAIEIEQNQHWQTHRLQSARRRQGSKVGLIMGPWNFRTPFLF